MTLRELSYEYKAHADTLSLRMKQLRLAARETEDPERRHRLERRILELRPLLQEARELAVLTRNYYDRRYHCLLYTSPSPRDLSTSRMPSSA